MAAPATDTVLMVSGSTDCRILAGLVSKEFEEGSTKVILRGVGAGAVNQAAKAIAISSRFRERAGHPLVCSIYFENAPRSATDATKISVLCIAVEER